MGIKASRPQAVVLGMFETALGPLRSFGRHGICAYAVDSSPLCAWHSRYARPILCPHPVDAEGAFVQFLAHLASGAREKPVLLITSDPFLLAVARNRSFLEQHYRINLPAASLLDQITDKLEFSRLMRQADIPAPRTEEVSEENQQELASELNFPVFVKARDVLLWRKAMGPTKKGFIAKDKQEFLSVLADGVLRGVPVIVQELVPGPDTNHWKYCGYVTKSGETLCSFTLRKIRQQPVRCGIGCCVESMYNRTMMELGWKLFSALGYRGVGSVEFKFDDEAQIYKVIELNPRYWQQNALAAQCGQDFALTQFRDLCGERVAPRIRFRQGVRWVNIHRDWEAYRSYHAEGSLTGSQWLRSLRRPLMISDFAWDDPLPFLLSIHIGRRVGKALRFCLSLVCGRLEKMGGIFARKAEQYIS